MTYRERITEARRLEVLQLLAETPGYEAGETLIFRAMTVGTSADQLVSDLAWLDEQGLVSLSDVSGVRLAKITQRGLDVAHGLSRVPGVARPLPGE